MPIPTKTIETESAIRDLLVSFDEQQRRAGGKAADIEMQETPAETVTEVSQVEPDEDDYEVESEPEKLEPTSITLVR